MSDYVPTNLNTDTQMIGGRRHRRQGHKTRKEPNVLKSWRKFVRKVQHEEHLSYPKAMKRASQRKSEWQRGGATDDDDNDDNMVPTPSMGGRRRRRRSRKQRGGDEGGDEVKYGGDPDNVPDDEDQGGGRRRRSRRQRGGNAPASSSAPAPSSAPASVGGFDGNWEEYGSVGGSRKRRRHRR